MPASRAHSAASSWLERLAEVGLRGLAEARDSVAAALPHGDLVGVHLEDLLLVEARFELVGDHDFLQLALDLLVGRKEESARELLRHGGAAAVHTL